MDEYILKRLNITLPYFFTIIVFPVKYRNLVINEKVGTGLKEICIELCHRYKIHLLIQSVPNLSISEICIKIKNITVKEIFTRFHEVKTKL